MLFSTIVLAAFTALASAAPAPITKRWPADLNVLRPMSISTYHGFNGAIDANVPCGEVSRNFWDGRDNTTLVTFDLYGQKLPATCFLRFWLEPGTSGSSSSSSGTGQLDVFTSMQPAPTEGSKGWGGPGNQRQMPLGRMQVKLDGSATVLDFAPNKLNGFPCPKIGDSNVKNGKVGFELAPVGDQDRIKWNAGVSGLYLSW